MLNINNQETGSSIHSMVKDVSNISYGKINFIILAFSCTLTCSQEYCTSKNKWNFFFSNIN